MNWDNLQNQWQNSNSAPHSVEIQRLLQKARERNRNVHQKVKRRDLIETFVALLIAPVFGISAGLALINGLWIKAFAAAFLTAWCLFVPWRLRKTRNLFPDPETSADMLGYLKAERRATQGQYELLRGVSWWYLGPAGFGALLFYASIRGFSLDTAIYTLVVLGLFGFIHLANQRAATRKFAAAIEQIDCQIEELSVSFIQGETT